MNDHTDQGMEQPVKLPHEEADGKKVGLPRPPLYTDDYITMAEALEFMMDQFGRLVLAIMYYTASGIVPNDLPSDLKVMFSIYQKKIDFAREKYKKKCAANAVNGGRGGKAKAENAKRQSKFKPPTLKQFQNAVKHFIDREEIPADTTDYDVDSLFDELKDAGWTIEGKPIQSRAEWERAISAKFFRFYIADIRHLYYPVFSAIFANFYTGEEKDGVTWADNATYDFMDTYDEDSKSWIVQGEQFRAPDWKNALTKFMKQHSECGDT